MEEQKLWALPWRGGRLGSRRPRRRRSVRRRRRKTIKTGLSEEELRMLGGVAAVDTADGEDEPLCPICLDDIVPGRAVRVLPGCNRAFHQDCVDRWLAISPRCPVCNVWITPQTPRTSPTAAKTALDS
ncbi:hypothetical protein GUJ93_ZPchr0006g44240 [Zizania palustris]|uniref:RING-type domain-containing protein n=1 Tax=Zizania palustris TaxID=103762 RepID=A0A8J5W2Z0_ZIZPA|nr:hypothetical protein GUJ93_ZPchr0006g44240 [Zizania palustris]